MISGPGLDWAADLYISICHKDRKYFTLHFAICFSIFFLLTILKVETSSKYLKHTGWIKWGWFCSGIWAETAQPCFDGCLLVLIVTLCFRLAGSCTSAQLQIQMLCSRENPLVVHCLLCKMGKSGGQPGLLFKLYEKHKQRTSSKWKMCQHATIYC